MWRSLPYLTLPTSPQVAYGYLDRPELTAEKFVLNPHGAGCSLPTSPHISPHLPTSPHTSRTARGCSLPLGRLSWVRTLRTTTPLGPGLLYRTGDLGSRDAGGRLQYFGRADRQVTRDYPRLPEITRDLQYFGRADRQVEVDREADLSVQRAAGEAERQPHWSSAHSELLLLPPADTAAHPESPLPQLTLPPAWSWPLTAGLSRPRAGRSRWAQSRVISGNLG